MFVSRMKLAKRLRKKEQQQDESPGFDLVPEEELWAKLGAKHAPPEVINRAGTEPGIKYR